MPGQRLLRGRGIGQHRNVIVEQPFHIGAVVGHHRAAACHELKRQQRRIGEREHQRHIALAVKIRKFIERHRATGEVRKRHPVARGFPARQDEFGVRHALPDGIEHEQANFECAPWGRRPGVEKYPANGRLPACKAPVTITFHTKANRVRAHTVVACQLACEPITGRDGEETKAVGVFCQHVLGAHGIEMRLVVLHEIKLVRRTPEGAHRIGRVPAGSHGKFARREPFQADVHLGLQGKEVFANGSAGQRRIVVISGIANHDGGLVAHLLEVPDGAKDIQVAA